VTYPNVGSGSEIFGDRVFSHPLPYSLILSSNGQIRQEGRQESRGRSQSQGGQEGPVREGDYVQGSKGCQYNPYSLIYFYLTSQQAKAAPTPAAKADTNGKKVIVLAQPVADLY
jgi:hypothetical protein